MKKALLTFVALTAVSAGFAQSKVDAGQIFGKKVGDYTSIQAPVKHELDNGNFVHPRRARQRVCIMLALQELTGCMVLLRSILWYLPLQIWRLSTLVKTSLELGVLGAAIYQIM